MLVAIDGTRASAESIAALVGRRAPGERVSLHAFRRDDLIEVELELAPAPRDTCYLALRTEAPARAVTLRTSWLSTA